MIIKTATMDDLLKLKKSLESTKSTEHSILPPNEEDENKAPINIDPLLEKIKEKNKLSIEEQILYLKYKGILFNECPEDRAKKILEEQTYYYKITVFRKNFEKDEQGKYINLDFNNLNDLAIIDMHLRYLTIKLSLDIEHNIKSLLISLLTESDEDGYEIVQEFIDYEKETYRKQLLSKGLSEDLVSEKVLNYITLDKKIIPQKGSLRDYNYDLISKMKSKISIWVLIELMSYGDLHYFIKFYVTRQKYKYRELNLANNLILYSKNIRDSAAHSRPIIFNIIGPNQFLIPYNKHITIQIKDYLTRKCKIRKTTVINQLRNFKIHDISALLILHNHYVKGLITKTERKKEMIQLIRRCRLRKSQYTAHGDLGEIIHLFLKIIKNYKT